VRAALGRLVSDLRTGDPLRELTSSHGSRSSRGGSGRGAAR
jgi:hypothetical protein